MPNKREISLTPEMSQRLADKITDGDDDEVLAVLRDGMKAEISMRAPRKPKPKPGEPQSWRNDYVFVPDHRVRITSAKILAEIKHGRPVQAVDLNVNGLNAPKPTLEAARELLEDWEDIKRIGDDYLRHMKKALPAPNGSDPAQQAETEIVDIDFGD